MKIILIITAQILFASLSIANATYCQDYMENGSFNPLFYPDLWTMDANGHFKKNESFLNTEEFKSQGSIEVKADKIILSKKFIPSVPVTRTEIELDSTGKMTKVNSYQVPTDNPNNPVLFSSYEFRFHNGKCYPYEEWDENTGTIYNTDFCKEARNLLQTYYKNKKHKKKLKPIDDDDEDNDKQEKNTGLSNQLSEQMKLHNIKYKDGKPYLDSLEARAKKQSVDPSFIIIEKSVMMTKACKEINGVSRALNDKEI